MSAVKMKAKLHPKAIAEATRIEFYSKEAAFGASFAGLDEGDKGRAEPSGAFGPVEKRRRRARVEN